MKKKFLKITAIVLAINFLTTALAPTLSYALTAGPTAPEYSTFEPIDTTQMVDLATGDFTYNIPLLEVPGPEGGYPLALSYHAGTSPDEESSWVGLGWNLNAGSINRSVSGFPDDFNNVSSSVYDYWEGGQSENFNLSVGYAGFSFGLTYSSDTYKGTGVGYDYGYGIGIASATRGKDAYGNVIDRTNVGISQSVLGFANVGAASVRDNTTGKTSSSISVTDPGTNSLGFTLSSDGGVGIMAAGVSGASNKSAGAVNTISKNLNINLHYAGASLNLGYNYLRYWTSEQSFVGKFGSLYYPASGSPELHSFDSFPITYIDSPNDWDGEVDKQLGGSLPAYDSYSVLGQGVGGVIQPYIFDNISLFRQNRKRTINNIQGPDLSYGILSTSSKKVNFRYKYDFSNSYTRNISTYSNPTNITELNTISTGIDNTISYRTQGFNSDDNHLAGSKHIEWFTVHQINDPNFDKHGFIHEGQLSEIINNESVSDQIGGFMITNESGVTYHYGLPVYEFNEYSFNGNDNHGESYRKETNPHPYAYTWLLTAITGPDFVDRAGVLAGQLDANDWGYWVKFNYGKWTDQYKWRNPTWDYHKQLDQNTKFYSRGQKELYYLDAVVTKSHTAIFEKKMRNDGKGYVDNDAVQHDFTPSPTTTPILGENQVLQSGLSNTLNFPVSTLALSTIYLYENTKLNDFLLGKGVNSITDLKNKGNKFKTVKYKSTYCNQSGGNCTGNFTAEKTDVFPFFIQNVIDEDDFKLLPELKGQALKVISLTQDYSLCKNTLNSFSNTDALYGGMNNEVNTSFNKTLDGKLTLKSIQTLGKGGEAVIPPTFFEYASGLRNPDYNQNKRDIWGMYKSDYVDLGDENLDRFTSITSAQYVDAWSLTSIKSALGANINIEYESDEYNEVALDRVYGLKVTNFSFVDTPDLRLVKLEFDNGVDLSEITSLQPNAIFTLNGIARYLSDPIDLMPVGAKPLCKCDSEDLQSVYYWKYFTYNLRVVEVGTNYITLRNPLPAPTIDIYTLFLSNLGEKNYSCDEYKVVGDDYSGTSKVYNFNLPEFIGGELVVPSKGITQKGGGLRVKSVSTAMDANAIIYKVDYSYANGATSYEPTSYNKTKFVLIANDNKTKCMKNIGEINAIQEYRNAFNVYLKHVLAMAPIVQGPGVIYQNVTIRNSSIINGLVNNSPEYKMFTFSTPKYITNNVASIVERTDNRYDTHFGPANVSLNKVTIRDYGQRAGNLIAVTSYDKDGAKIDEIVNTYLNEQYSDNADFRQKFESIYYSQGRIDQIFNEAKTFGDGGLQRIITRKEEYPNVLVKTTAHNYKTGLTEETYTNAFDYYTGSSSEVITKDSYGNVYKTISRLAYDQYFDGMGLKVNNINNKHMLSQNLSTTVYKITSVTDHTPIGLISAQVQTWSDDVPVIGVGSQTNIWRRHASYSWIGVDNVLQDGTVNPATFTADPFSYWNGQTPGSNSLWQKDGEITRYNTSSFAVESKDINDNFMSMRMDPSNEKTLFVASNAMIEEMAYSGAEYYTTSILTEGGVSKQNGLESTMHAHSGKSSLEVAQNKEGFNYTIPGTKLDPTRKYRASVWVYFAGTSQENLSDAKLYYTSGGAEITASPVESKKSKNWYLINLDITPNGTNNITIGCRNVSVSGRSLYFDDFRIHPVDCNVSSYVYDNSTNELTYILGNDNLYAKYEYDNAGRLKRVYQEIFYYVDKKVSTQYYNYGKTYR